MSPLVKVTKFAFRQVKVKNIRDRKKNILMLCFDKLKIVTSIKNMKGFDKSKFTPIFKVKEFIGYKYKKTTPNELLIMINYERNELVLEFTSKISELSFYDLISEETIYECLYSIAPSVEWDGYVDDILDEFEVLKCDVTQDVTFYSIQELERYVKSNLANYDKWKCEKYQHGFVLKNVVGTPRNKKRIVIYDKHKEIRLDRNKAFIQKVDKFDEDGSYIYNFHFQDKIRLEMNINTKVQIRELLNIPDNRLTSVLSSKANPILTVLNEALKEIPVSSSVISNHKQRLQYLLLKDCDFDLGKVEATVRSDYSKNTQIAKVMKPYRELHHRLQNNLEPVFDLRKLVV